MTTNVEIAITIVLILIIVTILTVLILLIRNASKIKRNAKKLIEKEEIKIDGKERIQEASPYLPEIGGIRSSSTERSNGGGIGSDRRSNGGNEEVREPSGTASERQQDTKGNISELSGTGTDGGQKDVQSSDIKKPERSKSTLKLHKPHDIRSESDSSKGI